MSLGFASSCFPPLQHIPHALRPREYMPRPVDARLLSVNVLEPSDGAPVHLHTEELSLMVQGEPHGTHTPSRPQSLVRSEGTWSLTTAPRGSPLKMGLIP